MSTIDMRTEVHQMIEEADDALLEAIYAILEGHKKQHESDSIVGYELDGTPITLATLEQQADEAMAQVRRGEYTTLAELEKESEQWLTHIK